MLRCPNCGTDNLMTAVFCRKCGKKIPIDQLSPDEIVKGEKKKKGGKANTIVGIVIIILFAALAGAILLPLGGKFATGDEEAQTTVTQNYKKAPKNAPYDLTNADASLFLTKRFKEKDIKTVEKIAVEFLDNNTAVIYARTKVFGIPVTAVLNGTLAVNDRKLSFELKKCGMGLLVLSYFNSVRDITQVKDRVHEALEKDNKKISEATCAAGKLTITRAAKGAPKASAPAGTAPAPAPAKK